MSAGHRFQRLDLFVTEACNLACDYCFAAGRSRGNLSPDRARQAVDWLMQGRGDRAHLTFWGGEPLLRPGLLQQISHHAGAEASRRGKRLSLSMPTNATLLDDDALAWIARRGVQVFLSIDGDEASQLRRPLASGGSSHALADRGLQRALGFCGPRRVAVRMTVTPENAALQAAGAAHFIHRGVQELLIHAAMDLPWSAGALDAFAAGQRELGRLFVSRVRAASGPEEIPLLRAWRPLLRRLMRGVPPRPREGPLASCGVGRELVALDVQGRFSPCHRFVFYGRDRSESFDLGDLETGVDENAAAPLAGLTVADQRDEDGRRCVECELFDLCAYGCPAISYAATGSLTTVPRAACAVMRAQAAACGEVHAALEGDPRYLGWLGQPLRRTVQATAAGVAQEAWRQLQEPD